MNENEYIVTVSQERVVQFRVRGFSEADARSKFIEDGGEQIKAWTECDEISSVLKRDDDRPE